MLEGMQSTRVQGILRRLVARICALCRLKPTRTDDLWTENNVERVFRLHAVHAAHAVHAHPSLNT
jgi:hypothetical protein